MKSLVICTLGLLALMFVSPDTYAQKKTSFKLSNGTMVEFSGEQMLDNKEFGQVYLHFGATSLDLYTIKGDVYVHNRVAYKDTPLKDPAYKWNYDDDKIKDFYGIWVFNMKLILDKVVAKVWEYPGSTKEDIRTHDQDYLTFQFDKKEDALKFLAALRKRCE